MSLSKFHSNGIITGAVDSCCLLCESHLRSEDEIIAHITEPVHQKNRSSTPYVEKFKDDCIRKVKKGYFCEFCNLLLSTASKVGLHVADPSHVKNKGMLMLKRAGNAVMAFGNILITEKAWNGIIDDTCVICNTEFVFENVHRGESSHILNLVQNKLEFREDNSIYRKVDDTSFHCLTCNLVLAINVLSTHFDETSHKTKLAKCMEFNFKTSNTQKDEVSSVDKPNKTQQKQEVPKSEVKKPLTKIEIKYVPPNEQASKQPEKPIEVPQAQQKSNQVVFNTEEEICKALGAKNYITQDEGGKSWCILCDWTMEHINTGAHIQARHHQTLLKLHKERLTKKSQQGDKTITKAENKVVVKQEKEESAEVVDNKSKILESLTEFQKQDIKINFESCTAMCNKCSKNIDFKFDAINKHIEDHKAKPTKEIKAPVAPKTKNDEKKATLEALTKTKNERSPSISSTENNEEAEKFAKENAMAYSREQAYCLVCKVKVPSSLKNMQEHIGGASHKNRAKQSMKENIAKKPTGVDKRHTIKKKTFEMFASSIVVLENGDMKHAILNHNICVNVFSFLLISKVDYRPVCFACEMTLRVNDIETHTRTPNHRKLLQLCQVVSSLETEFVREIRLGEFHCGFCNVLEATWEDLQEHLMTNNHRECKTNANFTLTAYMPDIIQHQVRREMEINMMMNMFGNGSMFF